MPENLRALVVVLLAGLPAFYVGRLLVTSLVPANEYVRWRTAWFSTVILAFLSGNFFIFAALMVGVCIYSYTTRPAIIGAFFVLLFAVPVVSAKIGIFGLIQTLFDFNFPRVLIITLLLPILMTSVKVRKQPRSARNADILVIVYVLLVTAVQFRQFNLTTVMRTGTILTVDILIPYFAISRALTRLADFKKVWAAFIVSVLPVSLAAIIGTLKAWPLYNSIIISWGGASGYSAREGLLRGSASAGPIVSGFVFMVGIGFLLPFGKVIAATRSVILIARAILAAGLAATLSRGPWVGAAGMIGIYLLTGLRPVRNAMKFAAVSGLVSLPLLFLPMGQRIIEFLPFLGKVDVGSIDYRQQLFNNSLVVIERNFWFGSADFLSTSEMQELVQGQGIVDIVNTYLEILLATGLVGLLIFLGFFAVICVGLWHISRDRLLDSEFRTFARTCLAIMGGILLTISTVSSVEFIPYVYWSFAGLCVALTRIAHRERNLLASRTLPYGVGVQGVPTATFS